MTGRPHLRCAGLLVAIAAAAASCRSAPPLTDEFLLVVDAAPLDPDGATRGDGPPLPALRVRPLLARGFLDRAPIAWREGDVRAGAYHYRRWGELPAESVTRLLVDDLRARGAFERIEGTGAPPGGHLTLSGELLGLHEVTDEQGEHPRGVAELELVLEVAPFELGGEPKRQVFRARGEVAAADDSMDALVRAIGTALRQVLDELVPQVEAAARAPAAARAQPQR